MSIMSAVLITIIALAVSPQASYATMSATLHPSLPTAFNSISNIVFAIAGHLAWVSFISELRDPRDFPKALIVQQVFMIVAYLVVSIVVYHYGGDNVASPALSSASNTVAKVAWGVALPTVSSFSARSGIHTSCIVLLIRVRRSSLPVLFSHTSCQSTSSYAYSGIRPTCTAVASLLQAPGLVSVLPPGHSLGSFPSRSPSSVTCSASSARSSARGSDSSFPAMCGSCLIGASGSMAARTSFCSC